MKSLNNIALEKILQILATHIRDDLDIKDKINITEKFLQDRGYQNFKVVRLEKDADYLIQSNGQSVFIPICGYWIVKEHKNSIWTLPQLMACIEAYEFKNSSIAIYAVHYPAVYLIIDIEGKSIFNKNIAVPDLRREDRKSLSYYCGYDERYRTVYKAGAFTWETEAPNEILVYIYNNYPEWFNGLIIDLGCGEGRDSLFLASKEKQVIGVDVSRAALSKARLIAEKHKIKVEFYEKDVIFLRNIMDNSYSLALNMGCLHMISDPTQRKKHLQRVFSILKPRGRFIIVHCRENWGKGFFSIPNWENQGKLEVGKKIMRRIRTPKEYSEIELSVIPYKESKAAELIKELEAVGFHIDLHLNEITDAFGDSEVLVAIK